MLTSFGYPKDYVHTLWFKIQEFFCYIFNNLKFNLEIKHISRASLLYQSITECHFSWQLQLYIIASFLQYDLIEVFLTFSVIVYVFYILL